MSKENKDQNISYEITSKGNSLQRYVNYQKELDKRVSRHGGKKQ